MTGLLLHALLLPARAAVLPWLAAYWLTATVSGLR